MVNAAFNAKSVGMTEGMITLLPQVITKAQALGFIMAIVFNVPCTMTVAATFRENPVSYTHLDVYKRQVLNSYKKILE